MKKAILKESFAVVQWHGDEYPFYEEDAESSAFLVNDEVLVLHEAKPNAMGKLFVIFNERTNESAVVTEKYLEML